MRRRESTALASTLAVLEFELRRAQTLPRVTWWCVLAFFPVLIVSLIVLIPDARINVPVEVWSSILFGLIPMLISMLGTFLWTTPAVSAELERQSWVYLAVRPHGRTAVLLGKYLAAIAWVLPAALVGASVSVFIIKQVAPPMADAAIAFRTWFAIVRLSCVAVPAYAAVYLALGTIFTKRAMVIAVAYTLLFELVVSLVPALINKLTIQYRLRALFVYWAEIDLNLVDTGPIALFGNAPAWQHMTILTIYVATLLIASVWLVLQREYIVGNTAE
jgi:ABC-type transport system involved in multi-copper enzyme maturation permease subunit